MKIRGKIIAALLAAALTVSPASAVYAAQDTGISTGQTVTGTEASDAGTESGTSNQSGTVSDNSNTAGTDSGKVSSGSTTESGSGATTDTGNKSGTDNTGKTDSGETTVKPTEIKVTPSEVTLTDSNPVELKAEVLPENVTDKTVKWAVADTSVASITDDGKVTGIKNGETKIIVTSMADNRITAEVKVTVALQSSLRYDASDKTWKYYRNGVADTSYTGFAQNSYGWWYVEKGKITFKANSVIEGTVNGQKGWWYVKGSKVTKGPAVVKNSNGWWYIGTDGKVDFTHNGVEQNSNGWWVIQNGKVNFGYTGFAENSNGWWRIEKGKVNFRKTSVIEGTVNGQKGWWYVKGGKVQFVNSVEQNSNGWWVIQNGKVNFNYTGFAKNSNGWWYIEKGKVNFRKTSVIEGTVNGQKGWWYVKGGKVQFVNSVEQNSNGWWVIQNGKVNFGYTGFAKNSNGWWRIEKGKVNFRANSVIEGTVNGQKGWWYVKGGKVQFVNSVEQNSNGWWVIQNGKVNFGFTGIASNRNGYWYIKNGKVDFKYSGQVTYQNVSYTVKNGRATKNQVYNIGMLNKAQSYTSSTGWLILVNRGEHKVAIFRGSKGNWAFEKYFPCVVGASGSQTITGVFHLGSKGRYFNSNGGGRCWYYSQIKGNYLFHSVIYDRSSTPRHITDGRMGVSVSHGCVRLWLDNAKYIYDKVPRGTTVVIYN